ncbi:MAG: hypothetical protein J6P44_09670 [Bacteroidales bacterium]|nr:hypothetical protein [Bacteroidales bacterium]
MVKKFIPLLLFYLISSAGYNTYALKVTAQEPEQPDKNVYLISNAANLIWLSENTGLNTTAVCLLTADIDMAGIDFTPIGTSSSKYFQGTFNGQGHTIYNLTIIYESKSDLKENIGLFGYIRNATIKNLNTENTQIILKTAKTSYTGGNNVGGIAGYMSRSSSIENCNVINTVIECEEGKSRGKSIGGIAGYCYPEKGYECSVTDCNVINSSLTGVQNIGGIIGNVENLGYCTVKDNVVDKNTTITGKYTGRFIGNTTNNDYYNGDNTDLKDFNQALLPIKIGCWNFIGNYSDNESLQVNVLNNNGETPLDFSSAHDIAASEYNYQDNNWNGSYLNVNNEDDVLKQGCGNFVWAFETDRYEKELPKKAGDIIYLTLSDNENTENTCKIHLENSGSKRKGNDTDNDNGALWFALSNPFNKALSPDVLLSGISDQIQGKTAVYTWECNQWNANPQTIYPGQGFMVAASGDNTVIDGNLVSSAKKSVTDTDWITFTCLNGESSSRMFATYNPNASDGFDNYDAFAMFAGSDQTDNINAYFNIDNKSIAKNVFGSFPFDCQVNFATSKDCKIELNCRNIPSNMLVSITDKQNNQTVLLNEESFTADIAAGDNKNRFYITFNEEISLIDSVINKRNTTLISNYGREITICGSDLQYADIFNTLGQKIYTKRLSGNTFTFRAELPQGIYLIKACGKQSSGCGKIVIR